MAEVFTNLVPVDDGNVIELRWKYIANRVCFIRIITDDVLQN